MAAVVGGFSWTGWVKVVDVSTDALNVPLNSGRSELLIDTVLPLTSAGLGADVIVTVARVALRVIVVMMVPAVPVPNNARVISVLVVAKGVPERLLPPAHAPVQVYKRRSEAGLAV